MDRSPNPLAHARLAAVFGSFEDAVIVKDLDGTITDWNGAAETLFGYTAEEAIHRHISLIAPPGLESEMADILARVARGERIARFETRRLHKSGELLELSIAVTPITGPGGEIIGSFKIARDVTQQRQTRAQRALSTAIISSSDDAIVSKDLSGTITSWNPAAEKLFGHTAEEAIGRHISLIAMPGKEPEMQGIIARIRRGERVEHYETQRAHKDGSKVEVSLSVSPIYDDSLQIIGASKIARDIRERRQAEQRLRLLMSELDHRAKNVLAVAQAILRLTRADTLPDYMAAVEGRLKALARVHTQVAENRWDGAELRSLITGALETFGDQHGRTAIEGPQLWVTPAGAQVIGVLLHELATNAAKHGALSVKEGSVDIRWSVAEDGDLQLAWREHDGPRVAAPPLRRSFGTQVIERNVPDQLGGTSKLNWEASGLACEFVIPSVHIAKLRQPAKPLDIRL